jgi:hypothetical protein
MGQLGNGNSGNSENGERCMHSRVGCGEEKILRVVWASNIVSIQNACQRNANARFTMEKTKWFRFVIKEHFVATRPALVAW